MKIKTFLYATLSPIISGVLPLMVVFWGYRPGEGFWLASLLCIPPVIQLIICSIIILKTIRRHKEVESFFGICCLLSLFSISLYLLAWHFYENVSWLSVNDENLSYICLGMIILLVLLILLLSYLLLHPEHLLLKHYRTGLKEMHFAALMHFFAIFLCIAFLAGFALAFHDRSQNYEDFYMENLKSERISNQQEGIVNRRIGACFYFRASEANFLTSEEPPAKKNFGKPESVDEKLKNDNFTSLQKIVAYIIEIHRIDKNKTALIRMIGKADSSALPKDSPYSTNFVLSTARTAQVQSALTVELSKNDYPLLKDIKWDNNAVSNDNKTTLFLSAEREEYCSVLGGDKDSNERVVEIIVEPMTTVVPKEKIPLTLMDYMYFSLYTITTTGYGDIKPVSAYAKFICSVENIIEVFFLVIFINIVISYRGSESAQELEKALKALTKRN